MSWYTGYDYKCMICENGLDGKRIICIKEGIMICDLCKKDYAKKKIAEKKDKAWEAMSTEITARNL